MEEEEMQLLWIITDISRALSVLQSVFINIISICRLCWLDGTQGQLHHCSIMETSLRGLQWVGPSSCIDNKNHLSSKSAWYLAHSHMSPYLASLFGFPDRSVGKESACNVRDPGSIPGLGRSTGEGIGYPLHCSWASLVSWWRIRLQCGRPRFHPWVGKIHWRRARLPTLVFWPAEFHGLSSPWGHK